MRFSHIIMMFSNTFLASANGISQNKQAPVIQRSDSTIHRIGHYSVHSIVKICYYLSSGCDDWIALYNLRTMRTLCCAFYHPPPLPPNSPCQYLYPTKHLRTYSPLAWLALTNPFSKRCRMNVHLVCKEMLSFPNW